MVPTLLPACPQIINRTHMGLRWDVGLLWVLNGHLAGVLRTRQIGNLGNSKTTMNFICHQMCQPKSLSTSIILSSFPQ